MEQIIEYFSANSVHLAAALVLAFIILFSFVKKLLKLGLVIAAVFIIYIAFLVFSGREFDPEQINAAGEKAAKIINEGKESLDKTIKKKKNQAIDNLLKENLLVAFRKRFVISFTIPCIISILLPISS